MTDDEIRKAQEALNNSEVPAEGRSMLDHIIDNKGNKWVLVTIFDHDMQEHITVLQPYPEEDDE